MKIPPPLAHPLTLGAAALLVLPFAMEPIGMTHALATEIAIFALVGLGFNLLLGYTGLVSFGHGAFFGMAAYASALLQIHVFPDGFVVPLVLSVAFAAAAGAAIGFLVLRRRGVYFSLLTLAFTALVFYVVFRWTSFTGGENGLRGMTRPAPLGIDLNDQLVFYYLVALLVFAAAWLAWRVVHSPVGSVMQAIRENEQRVAFIGYPVQRYKLIAFTLSATITGLAGSLFAFLKVFVSADLVHVAFSGEILAMSVIGGIGHFMGPPFGALFYILFRELLSEVTAAWQFYFGLLFIAFILFSPEGLVGVGGRLLQPWRRRDETIAAMAARLKPDPAATPPEFLRRPEPPAAEPLLQCLGVSKRFLGFTAVDAVTMGVGDRRLQALIGPNGAGKTTLFNLVSGMYPPDGGGVLLGGRRIDGLGPERIVALGLARSFQITNLFQGLSVFENLRLAVQARHGERFDPWRPARRLRRVNEETEALVRFLGLAGIEAAPVASLSYGGQRLLEIGLALATRPRLLLLDEPLAGLAAAERERIVGLMRTLAGHMGVLLVEHDIDRVFALADHITAMNAGAVLVDGPPARVREDRELQHVYLGSGQRIPATSRRAPPPAARRTILEVQGINTFYGKSHILHDVSLTVGDREVVALLGRNGAGKSSTFRGIMGLTPPRSGGIRFEERAIAGRSPEEIARQGIGLVPQGRRLFPGLTVAENLALGGLGAAARDGVHWDAERIFAFFPRLKERIGVKADLLSGGEQQMVAIARALSGNVRLLLLDEPFEGLSPALVEEVFLAVDQLRAEIAVLIVEHDLDLVLSLADRAYVLDRGHVVHDGPSEPLLRDLEFRKKVLWL
jgi:ABC-type branched-subunit amino acid transport system ATPase component/ABC-type branched-subunit amino acid transport system permease subunit